MKTMVRILVALISSILISSSAVAMPPAAVSAGQFLARHAEPPPEGSPAIRYVSESCQDFRNRPEWCAPYPFRTEEQNRRVREGWSAPHAKRAPDPAQFTATAKQSQGMAAGSFLSGQERYLIAPRPLTPFRMDGGGKAVMLGKSPEEKLRRMIGQLILTGFSGKRLEDPDVERVANDLHNGKLAGALIREPNIENAAQLRGLLAILNEAAGGNTPLIAVEQPGGPDTVLSEGKGFAFYNSASAVSSGGNPREAQLQYRAMAGELAELGVTLNIGPSEDVCRRRGVDLSAPCYGTSPSAITGYARAFKFGHHDRGVLTALRHSPFRPGLRTTWVEERPSTAMLHLLLRIEPSDALVLTVKGMEAMRYADLSLSPARPARMRGGRNSFHDAVIFEMEVPIGAPALYGETVVRALQSGADMILIRDPSTLPDGITALSFEAIQSALKSGRLPMARIEDAYRHAQTLKARLRSLPARAQTAALRDGWGYPLPGGR